MYGSCAGKVLSFVFCFFFQIGEKENFLGFTLKGKYGGSVCGAVCFMVNQYSLLVVNQSATMVIIVLEAMSALASD